MSRSLPGGRAALEISDQRSRFSVAVSGVDWLLCSSVLRLTEGRYSYLPDLSPSPDLEWTMFGGSEELQDRFSAGSAEPVHRTVRDMETGSSGNQLNDLPSQVFYHAPLLNLVLKDNLLTSANADWLPSNSNLTWLDLSGNRIMKAPFALLKNLGRLETLHLSQNLLEEFPADSFHSLPALERLHLDNNKLQSLDAKAFSLNTNLTHLFLQKNKLESLPAMVFHGLDRLQYLDLSENRLRFLAPETLSLGISWVELNLNPWHCDAKMEYLWKRLNKQSVQSQPTCASPESLKDRAISTLTRKELGLAD